MKSKLVAHLSLGLVYDMLQASSPSLVYAAVAQEQMGGHKYGP